MNWYLKVVKEHYADFKGRARRKEYWIFVLVNAVISIVLGMIGALIKMPWIGSIYGLIVLVPSLAVGVRRLHDIGKSGWMLLIGMIPIVGALYLIYLFCQDGEKKANAWGPNPKTAE